MQSVNPSVLSHTWRPPSDDLSLRPSEVHVWRADLDQPPEVCEQLWACLSPDERQRADRFYFTNDRRRFVAARGILRELLSRYLSLPARQLRFDYGEYGKPLLARDGAQAADLCFNLSHSHHLALFAFTRAINLGIDVEYIDTDFATQEVAEQFFSRVEVEMLKALPAADQADGFYNCWTRKEAYIKARGEGLSHPLHAFDVSLTPGEPARLIATPLNPADALRWSLSDLRPGDRFKGAIAVQARHYAMHFWQWQAPRGRHATAA